MTSAELLARLVRRAGRHLPPSISPRPHVGLARVGAMRRMRPVSPNWGYDRGLPIDRWYVERFLQGLAAEELAVWELEMRDPEFEVGVDVRARRASQ